MAKIEEVRDGRRVALCRPFARINRPDCHPLANDLSVPRRRAAAHARERVRAKTRARARRIARVFLRQSQSLWSIRRHCDSRRLGCRAVVGDGAARARGARVPGAAPRRRAERAARAVHEHRRRAPATARRAVRAVPRRRRQQRCAGRQLGGCCWGGVAARRRRRRVHALRGDRGAASRQGERAGARTCGGGQGWRQRRVADGVVTSPRHRPYSPRPASPRDPPRRAAEDDRRWTPGHAFPAPAMLVDAMAAAGCHDPSRVLLIGNDGRDRAAAANAYVGTTHRRTRVPGGRCFSRRRPEMRARGVPHSAAQHASHARAADRETQVRRLRASRRPLPFGPAARRDRPATFGGVRG